MCIVDILSIDHPGMSCKTKKERRKKRKRKKKKRERKKKRGGVNKLLDSRGREDGNIEEQRRKERRVWR